MSRLIAIGDIHGELAMLEALLDQVVPTEDDIVVFLGDYVDRGPDSKGVIEYLMAFELAHPDSYFLRGNHDQWLLSCMREGDIDSIADTERGYHWLFYGGGKTMDSYDWSYIPQAHLSWLGRLSWHLEFQWGDYALHTVHGGYDPDRPLDDQLFDDELYEFCIWMRRHIGAQETAWGPYDRVVCGHTPTNRVVRPSGQVYCLDGGACFPNKGYLRAGVWAEGAEVPEVIQVHRSEVYE